MGQVLPSGRYASRRSAAEEPYLLELLTSGHGWATALLSTGFGCTNAFFNVYLDTGCILASASTRRESAQ